MLNIPLPLILMGDQTIPFHGFETFGTFSVLHDLQRRSFMGEGTIFFDRNPAEGDEISGSFSAMAPQ